MVIFAAGGAALLAAVSAGAMMTMGRSKPPVLTGDDFGRIRRDALALYPIGSSIGQVAKGMEAHGFRCQYREHETENITAPTVSCNMAGAASTWSRNVVVLIARNGALTDIAVSNIFETVEANAETPNPAIGDGMRTPVQPTKSVDPEWDRLVNAVAWKHPDQPDDSGRVGGSAEAEPAHKPEPQSAPEH